MQDQVFGFEQMKKYFTFEVQVLDDKNVRRRFRASNYQSLTRVKPFICTMPMKLDDGWNQIQFNLSDFTRRAYGTNYVETTRVQVRPIQTALFLNDYNLFFFFFFFFPQYSANLDIQLRNVLLSCIDARYMPTVALGESTFLIGSILRMSCLQNSSCFCPFRRMPNPEN